MNKKLFLFLLIIVMITKLYSCGYAEELGACIFVNGEYYTDTMVENSNPGCILVALSFFEKFGYAVSWDNGNQIAMIEDAVVKGDTKYSSDHFWWAVMTGKDKLVINNPENSGFTVVNFKDIGVNGLPLQGMSDVYIPLSLASKITGEKFSYDYGTIYINLTGSNLMQKIYRFNANTAHSNAHFSADGDLVKLFEQ
jgi:hypothetical protein